MWQFFLQIPEAKTPESIQCALDQISKAPYRPPQFNQREVAWRIDFPLWSNRNTRAQNPIPVNKQIQMSACIILEKNHQTIQFSGREFQFSLVREKDLRFAPRGSFSCKYKYRDAHLSSVIDARTTLSRRKIIGWYIYFWRFGERQNHGSPSSIESCARWRLSALYKDDFCLQESANHQENFTCTSGSLAGAVRESTNRFRQTQ